MSNFINFVVSELTFLKYFMPITIEGNKRNIKSRYFFDYNVQKYNSPIRHKKNIKILSEEYGFEIYNIKNTNRFQRLFFLMEGVGIDYVPVDSFLVSIVYLLDFKTLMPKYINKVNNVVFSNKFFAQYYDKISDKNLYLGSTKYDVDLNKLDIFQKYNINTNKNSLIVFPRKRDLDKINMHDIYEFLHRMNYNIIVKTRGKDPVDKRLRGDYYFEDFSWFPHTTMELIQISDIIINFSSTVIAECIMYNKPLINFHIKPHKNMEFLYEFDYCIDLSPDVQFDLFEYSVTKLVSSDFGAAFEKSRKKYLFEMRGASKNILDVFKNEY